jgi:hypothetical protein
MLCRNLLFLEVVRLLLQRGTCMLMSDPSRLTNLAIWPAGFLGTLDPAPDAELDDLVLVHPWLSTLEPFDIVWEVVWWM